MATITTRWTTGALDVYSLRFCPFSRCSQGTMSWIRFIKYTIFWALHLKSCLINFKSKFINDYIYRHASHMEFNFPKKEGTGIAKLIPHVQPDVQDVIIKLLIYNSDNRMSAGQALKHPAFKELREADKSMI
jgi:serine/threonine protein kinase